MGVSVVGLNPKNEKGECFDVNWWWWRPIWYITINIGWDLLNREFEITEYGRTIRYWGYEAGFSNDCLEIPAEVAEEIGRRILEVIEEYERDKEETRLEKLLEDIGEYYDTSLYPFDIKILREWAEFCINCGGFAVC